jgi:hypothetical protein
LKKHSTYAVIWSVLLACILTSCAWEVFSTGHIQSDDIASEEIDIVALDDSTVLVVKHSRVECDDELLELVEMEVGELLESQGVAPDTIIVDLRN